MLSFPHSAEYAHFIAELKSLRERLGITQAQLALRLGVDRTLVTKAEGGVRRLDVVELRAWLAALGVTLSVFVVDLEARLARHEDPARRQRNSK